MNMDQTDQGFAWALTQLKAGVKVRRRGWMVRQWLTLVGEHDWGVGIAETPQLIIPKPTTLKPWIGVMGGKGYFSPWCPTCADLLSNDWEYARDD